MPVALDSQEGAKHVICIAPEQGNVSIDARCRGAKNDFPGKLETLYVNGSDLPSVDTTVAAKLKQDPSIDYLLAQGAPVTLTIVKSVAGPTARPRSSPSTSTRRSWRPSRAGRSSGRSTGSPTSRASWRSIRCGCS